MTNTVGLGEYTDDDLLAELKLRNVKYPIYDSGTLVIGLAGTNAKRWTDKYKATVVGFKYRLDGGISYRVRCWGTNNHWWDAEDIELNPTINDIRQGLTKDFIRGYEAGLASNHKKRLS